MMTAFQLLTVTAALFLSNTRYSCYSFSIPDTVHLMQTAASSMAHQMPHYSHVALPPPVVAQPPHTIATFPLDLLSAYKQQLLAHPLPTKMMTGATLAVAGDAIAQSQVKDTEYDQTRASSFAVFDMAYRALQHFSFPLIVANCHGQFLDSIPFLHQAQFDVSNLAAMEQTLASQLGIVPFLYYPAFFALTGTIQGLSMKGSIERAQENFIPLMKRNLLFWIPVQFVQFGYIQEDLQIPFLSVCGLGWTFILSVAAGSAKKYSPTPEQEVSDAMEEMMTTSAISTTSSSSQESSSSSSDGPSVSVGGARAANVA